MDQKVGVSIVGARGAIGQKLAHLLLNHPQFYIETLFSSKGEEGSLYKEVVSWVDPIPLPEVLGEFPLFSLEEKEVKTPLIFSMLEGEEAKKWHSFWNEKGIHVFSFSKTHRYDEDVPLYVPDVNDSHLELLVKQPTKGKLIAKANCVVIALSLFLKSLMDAGFSFSHIDVHTYQAISGAGYPGLSAWDICDNVVPYIANEEMSIEKEPLKIFSHIENNGFTAPSFKVTAHAVRVPILEGHLLGVSFTLKEDPPIETLIRSIKDFTSFKDSFFAPKHPLIYIENIKGPEPKKYAHAFGGMAVSVGRLRKTNPHSFHAFCCVHNRIRGGAGSALLAAERLFLPLL